MDVQFSPILTRVVYYSLLLLLIPSGSTHFCISSLIINVICSFSASPDILNFTLSSNCINFMLVISIYMAKSLLQLSLSACLTCCNTFFFSSTDKHIFPLTCSECSDLHIISHIFASCFSYLTFFKWCVYFQSLSWPGSTLPVTCHSVLQRPLFSLIALLFPISCLLNSEHISDNFLPFSSMLWT